MSVNALWRYVETEDRDEPPVLSTAWCARVAGVCISDQTTYSQEERVHGVQLGAQAMRDAILADPGYFGLQVEK